MTGDPEHADLVELTENECRRRLHAARFGRVALVVDGAPRIFPVHFAMLGVDPVFRTEGGTKAQVAARGELMCLEIDDQAPEYHEGWSVMVVGRAAILTDDDEIAAAALLPLQPWVGRGDVLVRVASELVTGRAVGQRT